MAIIPVVIGIFIGASGQNLPLHFRAQPPCATPNSLILLDLSLRISAETVEDEFETTLEIPIGNQAAKETAVFVQQSLGQIGVDVTIQELPGAAFFERIQKHELGFFFADFWISINNDPFYHLFWKFQSDCCNYTDYQNELVDALIDTFTINTDAEARAAASMEAQRIIIDEAPWVFLFQPQHIVAMRSNVKGYAFYSSEGLTRYHLMYKE